MAGQVAREWTGLQQFPVATQSALLSLLNKLRQQNVDTLTVLVLGKGGVGKSSTVNSLIGEKVTAANAFQSETMRPIMCSRSKSGFTLNIIDTPGLVEGGSVNDQAMDVIRKFLLDKTIDALLYVDRLDVYRVDNLDRQVIRAISRSFGPHIWRLAIVVLTHAQLPAPDGLTYAEFVEKRSSSLEAAIRLEAGFKKYEPQLPVVLVENTGRCTTNADGEKLLPDGTVWLPRLVEKIVDVVSGEVQSLHVDKKLIEGPNANQRGKIWIPLIIAAQFLFVLKPILNAIHKDIDNERRYRPAWEIRAEEHLRSSIAEDEQAGEQALSDAFKQEGGDLDFSEPLGDEDEDDDFEDED
eukprot:TRINITY_DN1037_c0_g1_i1.p1 TRINITY_DN1037_c0_g1~~TRINITY_DN1037_c0_g1_i1.p1  ORF type:complete len:366 (+),score=68.62 TRINITY_DN1037_c0_g1_i1:42-1100(+)